MDVSTLAVADTAIIHLKDAAGELLYDGGEPVAIEIYGPGSKAFGVVEARQSARAIKRYQENDQQLSVPPYEERLKEAAEDLAAITVSFRRLSCGELTGTALFEAVYANPKLGYITRQVQKALADWGKFKAGSAPA
jgi:hypothetical protein